MPNMDGIINKIEERPYNPNIKYNELKAYYEHFGFSVERISSSHVIFKNKFGQMAVVPTHNGKVKPAYVKQAYELVKKMEVNNEKGK